MKIKPIKIGNKKVGENDHCYIIAEIGSNFDGKISKAKKLIKLAKECGADAAKFQSFKTVELLAKEGFKKKDSFQSKWKKSVWQTYEDAELPRKWHKELNQYAKKIGIHFFTSAWDFDAVELLDKLNVPAIKVGSGDITYLEMLKHIGSKQIPVLLATGASNLQEIQRAVKVIQSTGNKKIILMRSVVLYPSPLNEANVKSLITLKEKFNLNVGYSDHSPGSLVALASVALGACVIEKHFTVNPKLTGPDHPHSMDPKSFKKMVKDIRDLKSALGDGNIIPQSSEKETRIIQRRGIWTIKEIKKGERFTIENIKALRPNFGVSASQYEKIIGKKSKSNLNPHTNIKKNHFI
jgi:sialic acid synthase SpsE